ncbi:MAG TPA: MmgE/PrpD family protein [Burkholderiales bacterium]|nr:MmgE/PrpD family protein [Burkholderiales bacterium]
MDSSSKAAPSDSITEEVATFVHASRFEDIPADVLQLSKKAILDSLGLAVAGAKSEGSAIIRRYLEESGCATGGAPIFGSSLRAAPQFAALANGSAMHADDYDDTYHPSRVHPSAPIIAALLADAEREGATGRDVLTAFNVGVEVTTKVSLAIDGEHYQRGYHATGTCGAFGAAAAVARLRRLPVATVLTALGIAGSTSAGLRENFGTMVKPLHTGRAAENGYFSAVLAALGFTAAPTILEGPRGFFNAGGGGYDPSIIRGKLGSPWTFASPGISIKPFPSGALTHPPMSKMQELVIANDIHPRDVERVHVKTNRLLPENLTYHRPVTGLQGKFSMEFCLASILVLRKAGLPEFTDEVVTRPDVQEAIGKIDYGVYSDEEAKANKYTRLTTFIDIVMKDGRKISARTDIAKGSPEIPMSDEDVADKFRECAAFAGWPNAHAEEAIALISRLEHVQDVRALTRLLARPIA